MEITIEERKRLHKLCFNDSDAYVDGFFKKFFRPENTVDIVRDQKLVATMHMKIGGLSVGAFTIPYYFVVNLCVHPDYRDQGLATELITKHLNSNLASFSLLHPFKADFYEKQGYVPFSYAEEDSAKGTSPLLFPEPVRNPERIKIYLEFMFERQTTPEVKIFKPLSHRLSEYELEISDGAECMILKVGEKVCGIALVQDREILDYELLKGYHINDVKAFQGYRFFHKATSDTVFNMARVANAELLLYTASYLPSDRPRTKIDFLLRDDRIPRNNGAYRVVVERGRASAVIRHTKVVGLPEITAEDLTLLTLGQPDAVEGDAKRLSSFFPKFRIPDLNRY